MKKKLLVILIAILLIVAGGSYMYIDGTRHAISSKSKDVIVSVDSGESARKVLSKLNKHKLVRNITAAKVYLKLKKPLFKANTYKLNQNMSFAKMVSIMKGTQKQYIINEKVKVGEGTTIPQAAKAVATYLTKVTGKTVTDQDVIAKWKDQSYLKSLISSYWFLTDDILQKDILYPLEGYFYPETYYCNEKNPTIESVTKKFLDEMDKKLTPLKSKIAASGYSVHQFLALTSVVERESLYDKDQAKIAGVFINRLNANKALQSDITVNYALGRTGVKVSHSMLKVDSKYNTYKYKGLPIGPISTVQLKTLKAVLNYEKSDYYYFFAKKDGTVIYSKTFEEHQKAVKENKWY